MELQLLSVRVVYSFLYCLVSSSLLFDISAHGYKQVNSTSADGNGRSADLLIKRLSPSNYDFMELLFPESHFNCEGVVNFTQKRGFIKSPNYPNGYQVPLFCRWNIIGAVDEIITISFTLIDIEIPSESPIQCYRTEEFEASLCCARNYLKISSGSSISSSSSGSYSAVGLSRAIDHQPQQQHHNQQHQQLYCGDSSLQREQYTSTSNVVAVEFNALENYAHARGFYLEYSIHQRKPAVLAVAASSSEGSEVCPDGKFHCTTSKLCIDAEKRCNGVVDCEHSEVHDQENAATSFVPDYSDELNCTNQLCRPEKGVFLCSDGRCILSPWSCDHCSSDGKGKSTGSCMKNSVITAAIIGSLVCLLLIVIAISCAIRLFGLRHSGHYRSSLATTSTTASAGAAGLYPGGGHNHHHGLLHLPFADSLPFPVMSTGDLDASLFRLDHSVFLREPPPSYASTMGGYADVPGGVNGLGGSASYMEQYRRYRRQRRCRRMLRRQQRMAASGGNSAAGNGQSSSSDVRCTSPPDDCGEENEHHLRQHRYQNRGHQFVNPLPLSPTAEISLRGMQQFAALGLRNNPGNSSAALPPLPPAMIASFHPLSSSTTTALSPPQPPAQSQANILQESYFEGGGGSSSKKNGSLTPNSSSNHLDMQYNSAGGGEAAPQTAIASTTFGVLPFSAAIPTSAPMASSAASASAAVAADSTETLELEPIPPLTNFDCDSQPLIR